MRKHSPWLGYALIGSAIFWTIVLISTVQFNSPESDLNVSAIHSVEEHVCDCSEQEKLNILLLERCKGK